jgi:flagellar protein FliS
LAEDLGRLYTFVLHELAAVNAHGDERRLHPVENILLELREGFAGAVQSEREAAPAHVTGDGAARRVTATF